jgi:hypothetical protein
MSPHSVVVHISRRRDATGAVRRSFPAKNDPNGLVLRGQPVEIGCIRDGEAAPRVDAGSFVHFGLDASSRLTAPSRAECRLRCCREAQQAVTLVRVLFVFRWRPSTTSGSRARFVVTVVGTRKTATRLFRVRRRATESLLAQRSQSGRDTALSNYLQSV